jgi:hypothetical protein
MTHLLDHPLKVGWIYWRWTLEIALIESDRVEWTEARTSIIHRWLKAISTTRESLEKARCLCLPIFSIHWISGYHPKINQGFPALWIAFVILREQRFVVLKHLFFSRGASTARLEDRVPGRAVRARNRFFSHAAGAEEGLSLPSGSAHPTPASPT